MKAIFEFAAAATRLDRAESAGDSSLGLRAPSDHREERDSDERDEGHDCRVPASAALRALSGFLDQCLDEGVELPVRDGIAWARWARRGGDGHDNLRSPIELVLLAS